MSRANRHKVHARDERHVRATRLRSAAPLAALAGPAVMIVLAAINIMLPCESGPSGCVDLERRSLVLLALAAPVFPFVVAIPGSLPLILSIVIGGAGSVPLWGLVGRRIADRVIDDEKTWSGFWRTYALVFAGWCVLATIGVGLLRDSLG
ncbi:MAG: hypothetical protein ACR2H3_09995 [Acidimicrobiales bacterium]